MNLFIFTLFEDPAYFFGIALVVIFSICCHEFMHAWVALKQGDPTAADAGHLTLNPLKQMGPTSLIMFAFIGIAWGQVPVRPAYMRHRWSDALVSFAGPATNLVLFALFGIISFCFVRYGFGNDFAIKILMNGALLNAVLFMLNMLPIPGLDGWNIATHFFPQLTRGKSEILNGAFFAVFVLIFLFIDVLYKIAMQMLEVLFHILIFFLGNTPS